MGPAFSILVAAAVACLSAAAFPFLAARLARVRASRGAAPGAGLLARLAAVRRRESIRAGLPGALLAMSTSVRAGLSLQQALAAAGERTGGPLGGEFSRVAGDTALGGTLESALAGFESRVPLPEVRMLVAGLNLSRTTGAGLAPLLERVAETLREREALRGQLRAMTAQGRMSGLVVGSTPVALLFVMWLVDPAFVRPLFTTTVGWGLLAAAAALEALGACAIRAIVRVDA